MLGLFKKSLAVALVAAPLVALPAVAQVKPSVPKTTIVFGEGGDIVGHLKGPSGDFDIAKRPTKFASMVKVRVSFHDELMRSVDSL